MERLILQIHYLLTFLEFLCARNTIIIIIVIVIIITITIIRIFYR